MAKYQKFSVIACQKPVGNPVGWHHEPFLTFLFAFASWPSIWNDLLCYTGQLFLSGCQSGTGDRLVRTWPVLLWTGIARYIPRATMTVPGEPDREPCITILAQRSNREKGIFGGCRLATGSPKGVLIQADNRGRKFRWNKAASQILIVRINGFFFDLNTVVKIIWIGIMGNLDLKIRC